MRTQDKNRILLNLAVLIFCLYFALPSSGLISGLTGELSLEEQSTYSSKYIKYGVHEEDGEKIAFMEITENPTVPSKKILKKAKSNLKKSLVRIFNSHDIKFSITEKPNKKAIEYSFPGVESSNRIEKIIQQEKLFGSLPKFLLNWAPRSKITKGLDLQGGVDLLYEIDVRTLEQNDTLESARSRSLEIIRTRVDALGVGEVSIKTEALNRIRIQLPGRKDAEEIENAALQPGKLTFHLLKADGADKQQFEPYDDTEFMVLPNKPTLEGNPTGFSFIFKKAAMSGKNLKDARVQFDEFNRPIIGLSFNTEGGKKFADVTGAHVNERLAIILNDIVYSAPVIQGRIAGGEAIITGAFTLQEARRLATILKIGALPAKLILVHKNTVGPSLGRLSIKQGTTAISLGFLTVLAFMIFLYRFCGLLATLAVFFNLLIIFAVLVLLKGTLTLPGIAGLILSIGMSVDANIIIYERIKEEFLSGKTVSAAIDAGFDRAWICILDSNITTLLTVIVLFYVGTGPIKGFAVTLGIGLVANMFTAVYFVKTLLDIFYIRKRSKTISIGI
ncbi:protein translocase subunit SecD [Candidatus Riflebacteria bacterium]